MKSLTKLGRHTGEQYNRRDLTRDDREVFLVYRYWGLFTDGTLKQIKSFVGCLRDTIVHYNRIKPILKENSDLTFSFKLFPFLVTSMSKTYQKNNKFTPKNVFSQTCGKYRETCFSSSSSSSSA